MVIRWLLTLACVLALAVAPGAMAASCAPQPSVDRFSAHCAGAGEADRHAPEKQLRCMGACAAVEVTIARLAERMVSRPAIAPLPRIASHRGIPAECATPPPRLS